METIRIYKSLKGFAMKGRRVRDKIQSFQRWILAQVVMAIRMIQ